MKGRELRGRGREGDKEEGEGKVSEPVMIMMLCRVGFIIRIYGMHTKDCLLFLWFFFCYYWKLM